MTRWADRAVTAATGALRVFGATARAMALDTAAGVVETGETLADAVSGRTRGLRSLPVRVLILADEQARPLTTADAVAPAIAHADRIFTEHAGIRVRLAAVDIADAPAPTEVLDPPANRRLLLADILGHTRFFRDRLPRRPVLSVAGDPVTIVVVRRIAGRATGCSLGMTTDWVVCQAGLFDADNLRTHDDTVVAHELGHALNLPHARAKENLMFPVSSPPGDIRGTLLHRWQAGVLAANRHVVPPL